MKTPYDQELQGMATRLSESPVYAGLDPMTILSILGLVVPAIVKFCFPEQPREAAITQAARDAYDPARGTYRRPVLNRVKRGIRHGSQGRKLSSLQVDSMATELLETARRGPATGSCKGCYNSPVEAMPE